MHVSLSSLGQGIVTVNNPFFLNELKKKKKMSLKGVCGNNDMGNIDNHHGLSFLPNIKCRRPKVQK